MMGAEKRHTGQERSSNAQDPHSRNHRDRGGARGPGAATQAAASKAQRAGCSLGDAGRYLTAGNSRRACTGSAWRLLAKKTGALVEAPEVGVALCNR